MANCRSFIAVWAVLALTVATGCEKENGINRGSNSKSIGVNVSESSGYGLTKAAVEPVRTGNVYSVALGKDTLYIHEFVSDFVNEEEVAEQAETKAAITRTASIESFRLYGFPINTVTSSAPVFEDADTEDETYNHLWAGKTVYSMMDDAASNCYIKDAQVTCARENGKTIGTLQTTKYWYDEDIRFWSYAPKGEVEDLAFNQNKTTFSFTLPEPETDEDINVASQNNDIIVGCNINNSELVNVRLYHAMADVEFDVKALDGTNTEVARVSIDGLKSTGRCTVSLPADASGDGSFVPSFAWTSLESPKTYYAEFVEGGEEFVEATIQRGNVSTSNVKILDISSTKRFLVIPQSGELTLNVSLLRKKNDGTYYPGSSDRSVTIHPSWEAGKRYTYSIDRNANAVDYIIDPIGDVIIESHDATTQSVTVNSYKLDENGKTNVQWEVVGYSNDGGETFTTTKPAWLTIQSGKNTGNGNANSMPMDIDEQQGYESDATEGVVDSHTYALKHASYRGSNTKPFDLSMVDLYGTKRPSGQPVTANCYVISAPGVYAFPLVYGNAINYEVAPRDGINWSAYDCRDYEWNSGTGNVYLRPILTNCFNQPITSPFIQKDLNVSNLNVCIIWQDCDKSNPGPDDVIITNISLMDAISSFGLYGQPDCPKYIKVTVPRENIRQGNALVALRDSQNRILWSWHLWFTDMNFGTQMVRTDQGDELQMIPFNVGWCVGADGKAFCFEGRECYIKLRQKVTGTDAEKAQEISFRVYQKSEAYNTGSKSGTNVYFQWGRKDPFLPSKDASSNKSKTAISQNGYQIMNGDSRLNTQSSSGKTIGESIQHPYIFYTGGSTWYESELNSNKVDYNLWDAAYYFNPPIASQLNRDHNPIKTVYDPCPPGFVVPRYATFTESNIVLKDKFYAFWHEGDDKNGPGHNEQGMFYTRWVGDTDGMFYQIVGNRSPETSEVTDQHAINWWETGYSVVWTTGFKESTAACAGVYGLNYNSMAHYSSPNRGCTVRPVREVYEEGACLHKIDLPIISVTADNGTSISFSWTPVNHAVGYKYSIDGTNWTNTNSTSCTVSGLNPNLRYKLYVIALGDWLDYRNSATASLNARKIKTVLWSGNTSGKINIPSDNKFKNLLDNYTSSDELVITYYNANNAEIEMGHAQYYITDIGIPKTRVPNGSGEIKVSLGTIGESGVMNLRMFGLAMQSYSMTFTEVAYLQ